MNKFGFSSLEGINRHTKNEWREKAKAKAKKQNKINFQTRILVFVKHNGQQYEAHQQTQRIMLKATTNT